MLSVNIQPRPAAILEGEREIILSQDSTLDMPLYLPELDADGVVVNNKKKRPAAGATPAIILPNQQ